MTHKTASLACFAALLTAAAELPPYLPAPHQYRRAETVPAAELVLPDGKRQLGDFIRQRSLNGVWKCSGLETSAEPIPADAGRDRRYAAPEFDDSGWDDIAVPLNWYLKYPEKQTTVTPYVRGYYRTIFTLTPEELDNRRVMLNFDVVGYDAEVFLNGVKVGGHHGDFTPFRLDATEAAKPGKNVLAVRVLSDNGPTFGVQRKVAHTYGSQWAIHNIKGGIWQDVTLSLEPQLRAERLTVTPDLASSSVSVDCRVVNPGTQPVTVSPTGRIVSAMKQDAGSIAGETVLPHLTLKPGVNEFTLTVPLKNPRRWGVASPYLYHFLLTLSGGDGEIVSAASARFGFREFRIADGRFLLNGEPVYLFGENIPAVAYGGTGASAAEMERKLESFLLGYLNHGYVMVRNAHMPIVPKALEIADECGIMIYNEWGWCFTNTIDPDAFARVNSRELEEFFHATGNHPSVTMWSLGNEVIHRNLPQVVREMDRQVALIRALDKQKRPVGSFSASGSWPSYGEERLDTDFLDIHSYTALSQPWTRLPEELETLRQGMLRIYGEKERLSRPLVSWENVGFSWGIYPDPKFRAGFLRDYLEYASRPTNWANPNGIGFTGCVPLFKAVGPDFARWAQVRYGRRIFELYRLNPHFTGFAPWFSNPGLAAATLWNQPLLPSLHTDNLLFPGNLFSGRATLWTLTVHNAGNRVCRNLTCDVEMVAEKDGKTTPVTSFETDCPAPQQRRSAEVALTLPTLEPGHYQMRLTLRENGRTVGRNYYDTFVQDPAVLTRTVRAKQPVFLLDTGAPGNVAAMARILDAHRITFRKVASIAELQEPGLLIVPPEIAEGQQLKLADSPELNRFLSELGGTLLVMEQKNIKSTFPGGLALSTAANTFADLVLPQHPVFRGLDYRNFDTWNNAANGDTVNNSLLPFTRNAVAAKGPMLGKLDIGMALAEAAEGKGLLLLSQLNAAASRDSDSAAATYLANLLDYASGAVSRREDVQLLAEAGSNRYHATPENLVFLDLSAKANAGFRDETANDGEGGWTDQGQQDFRIMPTGIQEAGGIRFRILDPERNGGKSCLVLRGSERPRFPAAIREIPVGQKFSRLFFLHTAAWGGQGKAGAYRIRYADGTSIDYPLEGGVNIGDWWYPRRLPEAKNGIVRPNGDGHEVATWVAEWENPKTDVEIRSIDFLSATEARGSEIDWLPTGTPVPVLVAVTGEKPGEKLLNLTAPERLRHAGGTMEVGSTVPGKITAADFGKDNTLTVEFADSPAGEVPAALLVYDKTGAAGPYRYLTFLAKSATDETVQFLFPRDDWQANLCGEVALKGDGRWHKYRLDIETGMKNTGGFTFERQRGELFLYYRSMRLPDIHRPAMKFELKEIILE